MIDDGWRRRLVEAMKAKGVSQRALSLAAGMGPGYVNGLLKEDKSPTVENLLRLCDHLGISIVYLLKGIELDADSEELLALLQAASPEARKGMLAILRDKKPS